MRDQRGIALPTALFATIASLGLAGAAVVSSVDVQHGSKRDNGSKSAIGAADAGANIAMQRLNRYGGSLDEEDACLNVGASEELEAGAAPAGEPEWCAPIEGEVGGAEYSYRVSALGSSCNGHDICIVSTGTADEVSRRIQLSLDEASLEFENSEQIRLEEEKEWLEHHEHTQQELTEIEEKLQALEEGESSGGTVAGLVGLEGITSSGNADIRVGVGTNGDLVTSGNTSICGDIQVGIGKSWTHSGNSYQCSGYEFGEGSMELPPVSSFIPSDIATNNSNGRITKCSNGLPAECQEDTYNGNWSSSKPFNPSNRRISLSGNTTLTVGGGDYWICSISLSGNSRLIMAQGAHVRFFFDTPENCGTSNQISMSGNNEITATGYGASPGAYDVPGFYLLGSTSTASSVNLSGNYSTTDEFVIYGPSSYVNISGNATFKGIVVGRQIALSGNGKIEMDDGFEIPPEVNPGGASESEQETIEEEKVTKEEELQQEEEEKEKFDEGKVEFGGRSYHATAYVECSGGVAPAGAAPDASC